MGHVTEAKRLAGIPDTDIFEMASGMLREQVKAYQDLDFEQVLDLDKEWEEWLDRD